MAVYQFIGDEFVLPKHYLPKCASTVGEGFSLRLNEDYNDIHDIEKQMIYESATKILNFIKLRKAIVIYHGAERKELCKGKPWNTYNHFHIIWKSSCEPRKDSSWYTVTKTYYRASGFRHGIPKVLHMKFPSSACNYYCKKPRQIIIMSDSNYVMKTLSEWCMQPYLEKSVTTQPSTSKSKEPSESEPFLNKFKEPPLVLLNYLNRVWTSKSYRSEGEIKSDWISRNTNPNNNFMRAISHPQYNTIIKKVIECNRIKLVN